ncbi:nitrile hydratase [Rhodococcus sp. 05-340-1]|jgi:urea transport system substrate-binding protein|uniref:ABC transporter substrate-binding protein n=1 Tax=unclassified Rhodococcus (in: high G+C Gram-positive bacteria) TaxID=192944 RepID=UPI000B9C3D1A|nr:MULTISPECIES: ABC transporter substrate-binding protein [unclassified Rhodococcus (in: high G+C Gram-positive bacteria)]OZD72375.1 nitrile hydratase [Rhodococcus sp. 05-340-2]OZD76061.1 nitrile hydratase [Rhodococcus sp. 05-340-1]
MSDLSVTAQIHVPHPPAVAYQQFLDGNLLDLECTRLVVGAAVSVSLPVGGTGASGMPITLLGHVAAVRPAKSVVVVHHQPWRGRLTLRFHPDGTGTRLVLESGLDRDGVAWLAHKRGYGPPEPLRPDRHRIGLLVSKSGSAAVFAQATETLARLAVDEINADGGIRGLPVELLIGDDASDSRAGATATRRLLRSGCRIIFACVTSATFNAAASALHDSDVLVVHTVLNEGGRPDPGIVRLGERPLAQARAGIPALMTETDSRTWFFVGHRYSWSYGAHWAARRVVAENNGSVLGDAYLPLGTEDFSSTIADIERSGAELILSSLVGHDEVVFEQQCFDAGLRSTTRTLALVLDEATQQLIGTSASDGVWAAFAYFQGATDLHKDLENRYNALQAGPKPPMSSLSETTYEAIAAYARILGATRSELDRETLRRRLSDRSTSSRVDEGPTGPAIMLAVSQGGIFRPR